MIYIGEKTFQGGYVGEKKISKIYIDNTVAYESEVSYTAGLYESGHAGNPKYLKMSWEEIRNTYPAAFKDGGKTIIGSMGYIFVSYFKSLSGDFIISDEITKLASSAFEDCAELTSIMIPDSVVSIEYAAFRDCMRLTSITIPDSVTSIGDSAFYNCKRLTSVTMGNGVTSIGIDAFEYCTGLTDINYFGTKSQWNAITKGYNWNQDTGNYIVHCIDGDIPKSES